MADHDEIELSGAISRMLEDVAERNKMANFAIKQVSRNAKGEGYLGEVYAITLQDRDSDRCLNLVIKAAFKDNTIREKVPIRMSFENETYFYSKIAPKYYDLMRARGLDEDAFVFSPKCLDYSLSDTSEMLALDNLKSRGFCVFDKKKILDADHVAFIFATYGKFHALAYAIKDQDRDTFNEISDNLQNVFEALKDSMKPFMKTTCETARSALLDDDDLLRVFDEHYRGDKGYEAFYKSFTDQSEYSTIIHGDCWSNNMMFKYDDNSKSPSDMRLLDFQLMKQGSPVCDLSYCLYSGASKEVFDDLDRYLKIYYDSFSQFLKKLGSDPEKVFPFSALKSEWKVYSKFGLMMALSIIRMKETASEDIVDLTDIKPDSDINNVFSDVKFNVERYNYRVRALMRHLYEVGAL